MASDPGPRRQRFPHFVGVALAVLAAIIVLLSVLGGWLLATESGARAAFSMLAALSHDMLRVDGVHGRVAGPLRVDRLVFESETQLVTLDKMQLAWQPRALFDKELHVTSLRIGKLGIVSKVSQKKEPARLPDSISMPFKLRADEVRVDGGEINLGAVNLVRLGAFAFNLDFDGARYQLRVDQFAARSNVDSTAFGGNFKGEATISTVKPYPIQAELSSGGEAVIREQKLGAGGRITIAGSLADMAIAADLAVNEAKVNGHVAVRPFSPQPLGAADLTAQAIDLAGFRQDLPRTRLNLKLSATESGAGEIVVSNTEAGQYNEKKLPLSDLRILFRQHAGEFQFDRIAATLGSVKRPAGAIDGSGRYAGGTFALDLSIRALDLQAIDQRMRSTRLAGEVGIRHAAGRQEFSVALNEPLKKQTIALAAHAILADAALTIDRAELRVGDGRANATGHLDLSERQTFSASGQVSKFRLKDVGDFAQLPDLFLNGKFSVRGARQPQLTAELAFDISDSRLAGQPLQGEGQARLHADRIEISRLLLAAGANRLSAQGRLAQSGGQLSFALAAPKLEQLGPEFSGALEASGIVHGSFMQPRINATWSGNNVRMTDQLRIGTMQGKADIQVDRGKPFFVSGATLDASARDVNSGEQKLAALSAQLQFSPQPNAPLSLAIRAQGLTAGGIRADSFTATATGTTAQHTLDAVLIEPGQDWTLNASGGLAALGGAMQWQGELRRFDAAGRFVARLTGPALLLVSQQRVQLDRFRLDAAVAYIAVEQFMRDSSGIVTRGSVERLQLGQLLKFANPDPAMSTDLQMSGDWNVSLTDAPAGTIRVRRDSGDVTMRGSSQVTLGLRSLDASASAANGQLTMQLRAEGQRLGQIEASGGITIAGGASRFAVSPDAPVSGSVRIDIPSLGWVGALISPTLITEGSLQSAISVAGTLSQPRLSGPINASGLHLLFADTGVDLRRGTLESEFQDSRLLIKSLRFGGADGQLVASGQVDLANRQPSAAIALKAERFPLLDRSDRKLRISGNSQIGWQEGRAKIIGAFSVDSGFFDISSTEMPKLSDDVVIVGRTQKKTAERGLPASIDVRIALGDGIALTGRGLKALLAGEIRLASEPGEPLRARGTLQVTKGTFSAYGRELAIEQGVLRFNGPLNNPALDIVAMRRGQEVEAGVAVRGNVLAPRVTLVSEPVVSEAEKLSWLVLGHGLGAAGESELGALQSAAGALLSQGASAGVQSQLARAFGLDEFSVGTDRTSSLQERIVTLGKQISSRLYVSFERGLQTASSVLHLRYTIGSKVTLEAETGTRSALSLFYNISFD